MEVDRFLTGRESEPWELLYFKVYKSQLAVIERALETAGLMLGTDKPRGYCLEMILCRFFGGSEYRRGKSGGFSLFVATCLRTLAVGPTKSVLARDYEHVVSGLRPRLHP